MVKLNFTELPQLIEYLEKQGLEDTKFMTNPDYIGAIIGLASDNRLVYDYDKMVEILAQEYKDEEGIDPHETAVEWIDFNCDIPYWIIAYTESGDVVEYDTELEEKVINKYHDAFVGISTHGDVLLDEEKLTESEMHDIEETLKDDYPYISFI